MEWDFYIFYILKSKGDLAMNATSTTSEMKGFTGLSSIRMKMGLIFAIFILLNVGSIISLLLEAMSSDERVMNLVEEGEISVREMISDALLISLGHRDDVDITSLEGEMSSFEGMMNALRFGDKESRIPAVKDRDVLDAMNSLSLDWGAFKRVLLNLMGGGVNPENGSQALVDASKKVLGGMRKVKTLLGDATRARGARTFIVELTIGLVTIFLSIFGFFITQAQVALPIHRLQEFTRRAAAGDLSGMVEIDSRDEIGSLANSINELVSGFRRIIERINSNSVDLNKRLGLATVNLKEITKGASESAASVGQITGSIQEISRVMEELAGQSEELLAMGHETDGKLKETLKAIENGEEILERSARSITELQERMKEITKISDMILDIADQTNLLALNAAIEAARAGEHGRGFAVVADEVRKLAEESRSATTKIREIIEGVTVAADGVADILNGSGNEDVLGDTVKEVFELISEAVKKVAEDMGQVVRTAETVASSAEEVSASTEEISSAAEEISAQTNEANSAFTQLSKEVSAVVESSNEFISEVQKIVRGGAA